MRIRTTIRDYLGRQGWQVRRMPEITVPDSWLSTWVELYSRNAGRLAEVMVENRRHLAAVHTWWDLDALNDSFYYYGVPKGCPDLDEVEQRLTYKDWMCFLAGQLNKPVKYLELGVSVGMSSYELLKTLKPERVVGMDIEAIYPVLKGYLTGGEVIDEWPMGKVFNVINDGGPRPKPSRITRYHHGDSIYDYLEANVWEESTWSRLDHVKFNLVLSDAVHYPDAIKMECERLLVNDRLDKDGFVAVWDDLQMEGMQEAFIWIVDQIKTAFPGRKIHAGCMDVYGSYCNHEPHRAGFVVLDGRP